MPTPEKERAQEASLSQAKLAKLISYDMDTGSFTWRIASGCRTIGAEAGTVNDLGYRIIMVERQRFRAHRLAFLAVTGAFPTGEVDHINGDPADNRWVNLREVTRQQNMQNTCIQVNNTSGQRGVYFDQTRAHREKPWYAYININRRRKYLGRHRSFEEARQAYLSARASLFDTQPVERSAR